jgi:Thoeris protein ThsB, TIR-like domain
MPELKTYDLFISHAWKYHEDYDRLVEMLNNAPNFKWRNYSVPQHDPKIDPNTNVGYAKLKTELEKQIKPVNCVIVLAGMYAAYSGWIGEEMNIADSYSKPMGGVNPWGQQRTPTAVSGRVKEMVGWNTATIIAAIRNYSI